jgi:hypothetical protein
MKITNKFNLPQTLVALASKDYYSKGKSDYSATEIISPPRIQRLRRKHYEEIEQDVSDMIWMLLGTALHVVAERSAVDNHTNEERISVEIDGVILSGAIDLQHHTNDGVEITDYKFTSAWALRSDKPEWEQQQNIYKYLVEKIKKEKVSKLSICAMIRDWSKAESLVKSGYPQSPIQMIEIPLWDNDKIEAFIRERIEIHRNSKVSDDWGDELPECTEEERWIRETKYALKKEGRKTAIRVLDTEEEAQAMLKELPEKDKGFIEIRKGEAIRCTRNYCGVSQWCSQYQNSIKEEV